jgi:itaconate CoA-transferase
MDVGSLYQSKLTTPDQAVASIPTGSKLSMGMAMAEPPALLKALADRAEAGRIAGLEVYYFESTSIAGKTSCATSSTTGSSPTACSSPGPSER